MATPSKLILPIADTYGTAASGGVGYTLVGRSMNRISYRRYNSAADGSPFITENDTTSSVNTRAQASIDIRTQVKAPGALGNDRIRISLKDTYLGSDGLYKTDSVELSFSFGRDPYSTAARRKALIYQLIALLGGDNATKKLSPSDVVANNLLANNARISPNNIVRLNLDLIELTPAST